MTGPFIMNPNKWSGLFWTPKMVDPFIMNANKWSDQFLNIKNWTVCLLWMQINGRTFFLIQLNGRAVYYAFKQMVEHFLNTIKWPVRLLWMQINGRTIFEDQKWTHRLLWIQTNGQPFFEHQKWLIRLLWMQINGRIFIRVYYGFECVLASFRRDRSALSCCLV